MTLPIEGCIHCRPGRLCEYHKDSNNPPMTPDTPKPPAPAPASAETLELYRDTARGLMHSKDAFTRRPAEMLDRTLDLLADALRRLQSTEQERFNEDHWFAEAQKQAQRAEAAERERDRWMASSAGYGSDMVEWKIRAEAAEQKVRDLQQEIENLEWSHKEDMDRQDFS